MAYSLHNTAVVKWLLFMIINSRTPYFPISMMKKISILFLLFLLLFTPTSFSWDATGQYRELRNLDVAKNIYRLRMEKKCIGCFLVEAKLTGMDLRGANLRGANLTRANLKRASLFGAQLSGAKLTGALLTGAQWIDGNICQWGSIGTCRIKERSRPTK